jgi:RNA polymerase sigma factor (sigma-70 family)
MLLPPAGTISMGVDPDLIIDPVAPSIAPCEDGTTAKLTALLVTGDEPAWREFHERYFPRLLRYLLVICRGDEHAARESLQAGLVKIVRHVRRFDREEAFWGWLTVVVRSCVIDGSRRQSRYRALLSRYAGFLFSAPAEPSQPDPLPDLLAECLQDLPEADAALLVAKYRDGETMAELAASFGCTEKAMESRLARLRQRVKAQLLTRLRHES